MATITKTEAGYSSIAAKHKLVRLSKRPTDQFVEVLPFEYIEGNRLDVPIVDGSTLSTHASQITDTGQSAASTFPTVEHLAPDHSLEHYAAVLEVDSQILERYGSHRNLLRSLIDIKVAAVFDKWRAGIPQTLQSFAGASGSSTIYANNSHADGGPVLAGEMEKLAGLLNPQGSMRNRYFVMHSEAYAHLYRNNYSAQVHTIEDDQLGPLPAISGIKVLLNNYLPLDAVRGANSDTTWILAVIVGVDRGVSAFLPRNRKGKEVLVRGPRLKESTSTYTWEVTLTIGLARKDHLAVAMLGGVDWQL